MLLPLARLPMPMMVAAMHDAWWWWEAGGRRKKLREQSQGSSTAAGRRAAEQAGGLRSNAAADDGRGETQHREKHAVSTKSAATPARARSTPCVWRQAPCSQSPQWCSPYSLPWWALSQVRGGSRPPAGFLAQDRMLVASWQCVPVTGAEASSLARRRTRPTPRVLATCLPKCACELQGSQLRASDTGWHPNDQLPSGMQPQRARRCRPIFLTYMTSELRLRASLLPQALPASALAALLLVRKCTSWPRLCTRLPAGRGCSTLLFRILAAQHDAPIKSCR